MKQYIKTCNPQRKWERPYNGKGEFLSLMAGAFVVAIVLYLTIIVITK